MNNEYEMIAKTFMGLEPVLAEELTRMGAGNVRTGRRMVSFTGDKAMMYRANFALRTAIRILKPIRHFKAASADQVYDNVRKIDWREYLLIDNGNAAAEGATPSFRTFAVDSVVFSEEFRHSMFVAYKVKDAIVDQLREQTGERPNVSVSNPDIRLHIHIAEDRCTLCLDSSGESLHRRGYKQDNSKAPINEVLAAGLILMTGWRGEKDFIDPMCGSGTLLIEAALIATNMAPGLFRKEYAFEKWPDYDRDLFDAIYNDDSGEREFSHKIYGYDIDPKMVNTARLNVRAAGLSQYITIGQQDFKDFTQPAEKAILVTNPPYGERISTPDLLETYDMIGRQLKHNFKGNEAWIISYREECFDKIGLRPSLKIPVNNGALECEFRKYQMFDGRLKDFRGAGNILKSEEEKAQMAEKHRFKQNRGDFKKRLADMENDDSDIRSFEFRQYDYAERFQHKKREYGDSRHPYRRDRGDGDRRGTYSLRDRRDDKRPYRGRHDDNGDADRDYRHGDRGAGPDRRGSFYGRDGGGKVRGYGKDNRGRKTRGDSGHDTTRRTTRKGDR